VNTPNGILFYNTQDGAATVERIDENGNHTTSNLIPLVELIHL
jgi:hypothetical protein